MAPSDHPRTDDPSSSPPLPAPPFIDIPGLPNFRDLGGYHAAAASPGTAPGGDKVFRRGVVFRASEPSGLTDEGVRRLRDDLRVAKVYDLRSGPEVENHVAKRGGRVVEWDGAERVFLPVFMQEDYSPEAIAVRWSRFAHQGAKGFVLAYERILEVGAQPHHPHRPIRTILEHLAGDDGEAPQPPAPILVHCSAGKDRTGVICAVLLSLCGVEDEVVAHEYSLTEAGLGHRKREFVSELVASGPLKDDVAGAERMIGARKESMMGTLALIREKYGSVERYVVEHVGLSPEAVERLRRNLLVDAGADDEPPLDWRRHAEMAEAVSRANTL